MKVLAWMFALICISFDVKAESHFFQTHRLLFFFASTCPYCHREAPIVKHWVDVHGASVLAYSFDGEGLPEFPLPLPLETSLINAAFQNHAIRYPALFILNVETKAIYPVSIGALDSVELDERLQRLMPKIIDYESKGAS